MTTRISAATGNFTSAATWGAVDATSLLNSEAANTALTTSYVESAGFTPGAITIDGIAVKIASVSGSPTGTISVRLAQGGSTVSGTEVTIDVADLPACDTTNLAGGFVFFKFASSVLLLAATAYTVSAKTSSATMVNLFRNGTAGNWSRMLRTTTTGAPGAGDDMYVIGEHTGQGTGNNLTVTMDNTASTVFGADPFGGALTLPGVAIGKRGTLAWGTSASTAYLLVMKGSLIVYFGGVHTRGTTGTPVPRTSTAELRITGTGSLRAYTYLVRNGGTDTAQGLSRTSGKNVVVCKLNTDEAVNSTSLGVDTDTGWLDNDVIRVASTTQTSSQSELGAMNGDAGASTLTVDGFGGAGGGLANAHSGTSPTQAEIINLTRNVFINFNGDQDCAIQFDATAIVDWDWAGVKAATNQGTVTVNTTTGSFAWDYCVPTSKTTGAALAIAGAAHNNWAVRNCVSTGSLTIAATSGTSYTLDNWTAIGGNATLSASDVGGTITNITCVGSTLTVSELTGTIGTINTLTAHSSSGGGLSIAGIGTVSTLKAWRCTSQGLGLSNSVEGLTLNGVTLFGNGTQNIVMSTANTYQVTTIIDLISAGDTTFATTNGLLISAIQTCFLVLQNPQFSPPGGIYAAHTNDINITAAAQLSLVLNNPIMGGTNKVTGAALMRSTSSIRATRLGQTDGSNQSWFPLGTIEADASTYHTAAPSQKLTPTSATRKLESGPQVAVCDDGATLTITVYVQKDGSYNGNAPRLILKADASMGYPADVVCDTLSVGASTWEALTYTTSAALQNGAFTFVIDCDGTAGSVFVDDWSVS